MKILHVVPTYLPATRYGGPIYSVHGLCKALAAHGHDVYVATTNVDGPGDSSVPLGVPVDIDGVKVWYFPSRYLRRLYFSPDMEKWLMAKLASFELVHLHSIFLWPTWCAARIARKFRVPYILSPRGMLVKDLVDRKSRLLKNTWLQLIEKRNIESAAALHMTSLMEEQEGGKFSYLLPEVFNIPNGVEIPNRETQDEQDVNPYILFLGRVNWKKGLDRLIPALVHTPGTQLLIAGNDEESYRPKLEKLAQECGVDDQVIFCGSVKGAEKTSLLTKAKILILPSYSENFGNVVLEAMAVGTPVVVTPEVGAAEIVKETGAGLVCKGEPEILGKAIKQLLGDPEQRQQMGIRGRKVVEEKYTWSAIAQQMEVAYQKVLHNRQPNA